MNNALFQQALAAKGLSQTKLAQRLDINPVTIVRAIRGDYEPRLSIARRMARELGVTVDALFPGEDGPKPTGTDAPRVVSIRDAGRKGGKARAAKLTPEQRSEAARAAINARWAKVRASKAVSMYARSLFLGGAANDGASCRRAA